MNETGLRKKAPRSAAAFPVIRRHSVPAFRLIKGKCLYYRMEDQNDKLVICLWGLPMTHKKSPCSFGAGTLNIFFNSSFTH